MLHRIVGCRRFISLAARRDNHTIVGSVLLCYRRPRSTGGDVAEWLRSGLQIRVRRFDSGRRLQRSFKGLKSGEGQNVLCKAGTAC